MKYKVYIQGDNYSCINKEIIEIEDNATDEEIEEICREVAFNYVEWGYEKVEFDKEVVEDEQRD